MPTEGQGQGQARHVKLWASLFYLGSHYGYEPLVTKRKGLLLEYYILACAEELIF
jgi:hypothetical protein